MLTSLGRPDLQTSQSVGHLKSVVYQTRPTSLAQLKTQIEKNIANIAPRYAKSSESTY
jgi:hypothetical protein